MSPGVAGEDGAADEVQHTRGAMHADGVALDVVLLPQEQAQFELEVRQCRANVRSACGPAGSMVSMTTLEGFQPDLSLLAVHGSYQALLDAVSDDLQFQTQVYGDYLQPGDVPMAVVVDSASNTVDVVTLAPAEDSTPARSTSSKGTKSKDSSKSSSSGKRAPLKRTTVFPSAHIADTLRAVRTMAKMGVSPDSCVMYIADRHQEVFVALFSNHCSRVVMSVVTSMIEYRVRGGC